MTQINYNSPKWFNSETAKLLSIYDDKTTNKIFFKKDRNIKTQIYKLNNKLNIDIDNNPSIESKIIKQLDDIINNYKPKFNKNKTIKTKFIKEINGINKVTRVKKYIINFNKKQIETIQNWIYECRKLYNICIDKHNTDNTYFNKGYKAIKANLLNEVYKNKKKPVPYDVLSDEIRIFCSNLKSCYTNLKNKNIKYFKIKKKTKKNTNDSLLIPSKSIQKNGIFSTILGPVNKLNLDLEITHDSRLFYNHYQNNYTLMIPTDVICKQISNRESICAIDPGEKKFIEFVGSQSYGYIGKNMRKVILKNRNQISKYQKILSKGKNKNGKSIKNKKHIIRKIRKLYKKNKNIVKELHNQTANYLCKNYDKILIPKFQTQNMIKHKKEFKVYKKDFINTGTTNEEKKYKAKELTKKCRLNKNVKYVLNSLSHYQFRQHLIDKSNEYGCIVKVITEEDTSCTCSNCGHKSNIYNKRQKECENCKYKIDRDLNGAKNILIKNLKVFNYKAIKLKASYKPI